MRITRPDILVLFIYIIVGFILNSVQELVILFKLYHF